jgi:flagellar basal body rod protein FlgG
MNVSLYQAAAAMNANLRWQEAVSNNLASCSIPGARKQEVSFSAVEAGVTQGVKGGGVSVPSVTTSTNFEQGPLRSTSLPTDVGIEGPGFIEVQLPNGGHAFTRDGELHLSAQGQLVTKQGYQVVSDGGTLQIDPSNASPISIAPTGEVSQGGEVRGRIRLAEFAQPGLLKNIGEGCFVSADPSMQPNPAVASMLRQGFLEGSNGSPTTEMATLLTSMRMYEANQKIIQMQDDRMGKVIAELGSPS